MENIVLLTVGMLYLTKISNNVQLYIIIYLGGKAMKRLVGTLLFVVIALSLSGCENSKSKETTNSKTDIVSVTNSKDDNKTKNEVMGKILLEDEYAKIETLLEKMNETEDLKNKALQEKIDVANHRISDLEDAQKWLQRTVLGAIITGAIALLFAFVK